MLKTYRVCHRVAVLGFFPRNIFHGGKADDFLKSALHPSPPNILAHQVQRLAICGHIQIAALHRPGKIEEVCILDDDDGIETFLDHPGTQPATPEIKLGSRSQTHC